MEKTIGTKKRLVFIDAAKGFAMILVVMGHVLYFSIGAESDFAWSLGALQVIAHYHMPMFVFVSGLMMKPTDMAIIQILNGYSTKIVKLLIPFLFFGLIYSIAFQKGIVSFFLDGMKHGYWYLWVLAEYYVFSALFECFCKHPHGKIVGELLFAGVIFLGVRLLNGILLPQVSGLFSLHNYLSYFPCFFGGMLIRRYSWYEDIITTKHFQAIITSLVIIGMIVPTLPLVRYWHLAAVIILIIQILYIGEKRIPRFISPFAFVGRSSLDIYILHYFLVSSISLICLQPFMLVPGWGTVFQVLASFVVALPISALCIYVGKLIHNSQFIETYIFCKTRLN